MSGEGFEGVSPHAYPRELVSFILDRCKDPSFMDRLSSAGVDPSVQLPDRALLEQIISTCYQASLMREEERPITFRLILRDSRLFASDDGPPGGLHRLCFAKTRPFNEQELHRLAPAADFHRALIGAAPDGGKGAQIWGIVHSGTRWTQPISGGTKAIPPLPPSPVIHVRGPGSIGVSIGPELIASLNGGQVSCPSLDIFSAAWLAESFASVRAEIDGMHEAARARSGEPWADLDPKFGRTLSQQVIRRIVSLISDSRHGGMLVYIPAGTGGDISEGRCISLKYRFREEEPRLRLQTLILKIMGAFAKLHGGRPDAPARVVGWQDYVSSRSEEIALLDEAIFDFAHFIASLAAVDGAIVMTKRLELLGFGGVISGEIEAGKTIARALDMEGRLTRQESIEEVGTRHRAAYRLCHEMRDALAVVISQDGNARLVKWHKGSVTYWDLSPAGVPGV